MKIALVCQSLEPGRSGVGDYTWRLAAALGKMGHDATVVSFWDGFVKAEVNGERLVGCQSVKFHRLPEVSKKAAARVSRLLEKLSPEWVSLQFVPYSFHHRGFVNGRRFSFDERKTSKRHLMVHETWIGGHPGASYRERAVGLLQKGLCQLRIRQWQPDCVHTSCELYERRLRQAGMTANILPMFGTLDHESMVSRDQVRQRLIAEQPRLMEGDLHTLRWMILFGTIYDLPSVVASLRNLAEANRSLGMRLVVIIAGCPAPQQDLLAVELGKSAGDILLLPMPRMEDARLSQLFQAMDFGMSATPLDGVGKSSAAASMRDHGLAVLCPSRGAYEATSEPPFYWAEDFIKQGFLDKPPVFEKRDRVYDVASQFLKELAEKAENR